MYKLINWWLARDGDSWILHGNNAPIGSNPFFHVYDLIETRASNISVTEVGFLMKTNNETYICSFNDSLETRFEWLLERNLWEEKLLENIIEDIKNKILKFQEQRVAEDIKDIEQYYLKREHIELLLADCCDNLYAVAICSGCKDDAEVMNHYFDGEMVYYYKQTESKEIYRKYRRDEIREIVIDDIWSWAIPLLVKNIGKEAIEINTSVGLFRIPADELLYLIGPEVFRGRVSGC